MTNRISHRITLLSTLLLFVLASQLSSASAPSIDDIKPEIISQLPGHLELIELSFNHLENAGNEMMPMYRASVAIKAKLKEPLYIVDGNENGKIRLRQSIAPGTTVSHTATVIALMPGGFNKERKVTVVLDKNRQYNKQLPESAFPNGTYIITTTTESSSTASTTYVLAGHQPDMGPIRALISAQNENRELWGKIIQNYRNVAPANSPIVLKNIELKGNEAKAKIDYPDQEKSFDVTIVPLGSHMIGFRCIPKENSVTFPSTMKKILGCTHPP